MRFFSPPGGLPWALYTLCGTSLVVNVVFAVQLASHRAPPSEPCPVAEVLPPTTAPAPDPVAEVAAAPVVAEPVMPDGMQAVRAEVSHSLARTFQSSVSEEQADAIAAVYARLFFWKLDLRKDLQKGDEVSVAWTWDGELPQIPVASYSSKKLGAELHAYQFQATGDAYPSWWDEDGTEVAERLVGGPLDEYEQVTSLLKDRPGHRGMDFKVEEGTPVYAPRAGTVARVNWNVANNGDCVEVEYRDGTVAKFLHLSETSVRPGARIDARTVIGRTGNTGHSTAPHLHYELSRGGEVVDPVDYHGTHQRTLAPEDRERFAAEVERLDELLRAAT